MLENSKNDQVFTISPYIRVVANYANDCESIQEVVENMGLAIQTLRVAKHFTEYKTHTEFTEGVEYVIASGVWDNTNQAVIDYFTAEQVPFVIYNLKGFSQSEWHDVVIYDIKKTWTPEQLAGIGEYIDAMFAGEVYETKVQHAKVYTAKDGSEIVEWLDSEDYYPNTVTEKLFNLNADYILDTFSLEVIPEVEG